MSEIFHSGKEKVNLFTAEQNKLQTKLFLHHSPSVTQTPHGQHFVNEPLLLGCSRRGVLGIGGGIQTMTTGENNGSRLITHPAVTPSLPSKLHYRCRA